MYRKRDERANNVCAQKKFSLSEWKNSLIYKELGAKAELHFKEWFILKMFVHDFFI